MSVKGSFPGPQAVTLIGLVVGAVGIAILWASASSSRSTRRRASSSCWPARPSSRSLDGPGHRLWGHSSAFFVTIGFLISPTGWSNLTGEAGASVAIGRTIRVIGVLTALIAGVVATRGQL